MLNIFRNLKFVPMEIQIGEKAPLFGLRAHDRSMVQLDDFAGQPVVLLFFPFAFSSVCTGELCTMQDDLGAYEQLKAQVLAISVDSFYSLAQYRSINGYSFPLLSDFNKETSRSYGALHEHLTVDLKGVSKRAVFVIDKNGTLLHKEILEVPSQLPNFEKVKEVLATLS